MVFINDLVRPEIFKTALGRRLREVRRLLGDPDREIFGETLEVSARALATYERGDNEPSSIVLCAYRDVHGVDLNWLLSGQGELFADPSKAPAVQIDAELMERLHDRVASIFHDAGQKPPQRRIAREAANLYNELAKAVADLTDTELVDATLPQIALSFKRRLEQAADEPGSGKRSAS